MHFSVTVPAQGDAIASLIFRLRQKCFPADMVRRKVATGVAIDASMAVSLADEFAPSPQTTIPTKSSGNCGI